MSYRTEKIKANYVQLCKQLKNNPHYQAIGGQQGQQTIKSAIEADLFRVATGKKDCGTHGQRNETVH